MFKYFIGIFILMLLNACQNKETVSYTAVFEANLGFEENEVGSNIPILENYPNRRGFTDNLLIDIPKPAVYNGKVYIADSYNKRVNVFSMKAAGDQPLLSIPREGKNYSFARPYDVYVDVFNDIYVLASIQDIESYEVQNYSNQTAAIDTYDEFLINLEKISENNFYLYKFSSRGDYLYRIGFTGINSKPMPYPVKISGDDFANIYLNFRPNILTNEMPYQVVRRYSKTGDLNFEFNTKTVSIDTNIQDTNYQGHVISADNYMHNEQLVVLSEYQPTTNALGETVLPMMDNIWSSMNIYSILENDFTEEVFHSTNITESILGIDKLGRIHLQSYDEKEDTMKIRVFDSRDQTESIIYTPIHSSYYILYDYFIDEDGNLYNYLIDRKEKVILLRWDTEKPEEDKK